MLYGWCVGMLRRKDTVYASLWVSAVLIIHQTNVLPKLVFSRQWCAITLGIARQGRLER
jgi:hypothetical protein